jgi:hypothetical protein
MKMLHAILCTQTSPLSSPVLPQPLYSLVVHPRSRMYTVLNMITSFLTPLKIPLSIKGLPIAYLVTEAKLSLAIKSNIFYEHFVLISGKVNHTSTTRILRNDATRPLRMLLIASLIVLGHPHTYGCLLTVSCYLLNQTYSMSIDSVPLTKLLGSTVDIFPLLCFHFWECVYYHQSETSFPSDSKEGLGNIGVISEHCGHALTYKALMPHYHWRRQFACQHVCRSARHP